jgi:DNA polymerase III epsilon subunit-like protein
LDLVPDDGIYHVTPGAIEVNGIDLVEHGTRAMPYSDARSALERFLNQGAMQSGEKPIPVGFSLDFDLGFIWKHLMDKASFETGVSHHRIDLSSIVNFLFQTGRAEKIGSMSLKSVAEYFGIERDGCHAARDDAMTTIKLFEALDQHMIFQNL